MWPKFNYRAVASSMGITVTYVGLTVTSQSSRTGIERRKTYLQPTDF